MRWESGEPTVDDQDGGGSAGDASCTASRARRLPCLQAWSSKRPFYFGLVVVMSSNPKEYKYEGETCAGGTLPATADKSLSFRHTLSPSLLSQASLVSLAHLGPRGHKPQHEKFTLYFACHARRLVCLHHPSPSGRSTPTTTDSV